MTEIAEIMHKFWNSFSIPAYVEYSVPVKTQCPYITYTLSKNEFTTNGLQQVRLWYKSSSFMMINAKIDEIEQRIGKGIRIPLKKGCLILYKGSPFVQFQPSDDPSIKIAYLNLEVSYLTK